MQCTCAASVSSHHVPVRATRNIKLYQLALLLAWQLVALAATACGVWSKRVSCVKGSARLGATEGGRVQVGGIAASLRMHRDNTMRGEVE